METRRDPWRLVPPRWLLLGVLAVVTAAFLPTLGFGFVYDDHWTLLGNGFLRSPGDVPLLLSSEATARHVPDAFRPASVLFEMLAYQLLGQSSIGHHALSVLLHVAVTFAVAAWLDSLGAPLRLRIASALVFGLLAIHAEAVAVVSYREDLLAALFGLLAMIAATRGLDAQGRPRAAWLAAAAMLAALAAGSKLSAAPIPLLWLLAHRLAPWRPRRGPAWLGFAALALGVALVLAQNWALLGGISPYEEASGRVYAHRVGWSPVWAASIQIHLAYLQQLVFPRGLSPEYVDSGARWSDAATLCGLGAFALILVAAIASVRRRPIAALAILGALLLALPTSNLAPMPNMRADRFMYLPSVPVAIGFAAILLAAGDTLARRSSALVAGLVPLLAFVIVQGAMAQGAAAVFRSDTRLWEIAIRLAPGSARAHAIHGELLVNRLRSGDDPDGEPLLLLRARTHCALALRLDPLSDLPHMCQARLHAAQREWTEAHAAFTRGLERTGVRRDRALVALASTALDLPDLPWPARVDRALTHLERATREYPYTAEVFAIDGRIRHRLGQPEAARSSYRRASNLHPERWDVVLAGLELELDLGHSSAAQDAWTEAEKRLRDADPTLKSSVGRKLGDARRLFAPGTFDPSSAPSSSVPLE